MTKDEALRLALEALEEYCEHGAIFMPITVRDTIKAALEAKDEPVAQGSIQHLKIMMEESAWEGRIELSDALANIDEFYTTPPQRTWVRLTKEDMPDGENPMFDHEYFIAGMVFAAKILEEKNT
jgi:hypothetical protein